VSRRLAAIASAAVVATAGMPVVAPHAAAAPITLPDLRIFVPTDLISIGNDPSSGVRDLRFTHRTADVGAGPFELDPRYDPATGTSTFVQAVYNSPSPGVWRLDHTVPVAATGVWRPPSDYQFPLTRFTLNRINADGSVGGAVATSPKHDYCMTGDYRLSGVANTPDQTAISQGDCTDPTKPLGWSVGWSDQYDQTDSGQPINLSGVPDGTYILQATVDPLHVLTESNVANDVTDTKLTIHGYQVTVLSQSTPGSPPVVTPPPHRPHRGLAVSIVNPTRGEIVSGTVPVAARLTHVRGHVAVRFFLDGRRLGRTVRRPPYAIHWNTRRTRAGTHTLSVRAAGRTARVVVTVENPPPPMTCFVLQAHVSARGAGAVTASAFHTAMRGQTLVAFVSADGPSSARQTATVTGAGLHWILVSRANALPGDAEIWVAHAPAVLTHARVSSTTSIAGYSELESVIAVEGSQGVGSTAAASSPGGPPSLRLHTRAAVSLVFAVGHDWDHAVARVLAPGWVPLDQWLQSATGDSSWVQYTNAATGRAGTLVNVHDHSPVADQWNFAAVELRGGG
jgi:Bacterial Ig domain/Lysyl oxidase